MFVFLGALAFMFFSSSSEEKTKLLYVLHIPDKAVKGTSTQRAEDISSQIKSDIASSAAVLKEQVLNVRVADALGEFHRIQKIPRDINSLKEFAQDQLTNLLKKK